MIHSSNILREEVLARLENGNKSAQRKEQIRAVASDLNAKITDTSTCQRN